MRRLPLRSLAAAVAALLLAGCASTPSAEHAPAAPLQTVRAAGVEIVPLAAAPGWRVCAHDCEVLLTPKSPILAGPASAAAPVAVPQTERYDIDAAHFASGRATLADAQLLELPRARLRSLLDGGWRLHIEVAGYTDATGDAPTNARLAQARADSIAQALRAAVPSADADRVHVRAVGYPQCCYVGDNSTAAGRAANRRVTISVRAERAHLGQSAAGGE